MTDTTELAAALAFVLARWKEAGATKDQTQPFDELLADVDAPPKPDRIIGREITERTQPAAYPRLPPARETFDDYGPKPEAEQAKDPDWTIGTGDRGRT